MKVLVTGANGFVGRHLVAALLERGHQIIAVARDADRARAMPWFTRVEFIFQDVHRDPPEQLLGAGIPDAVVHLAWPDLPNYRSLSHVERTLPADTAFLRGLMAAGVGQLLVTGTCAEYGMASGPLSESLAPNPANPYAIAKNALRQLLEPVSREAGCRLQWARLFYTFGEGQNPNSLLAQLDRAIDGGERSFKMSGGEQLRDYLPIAEMAAKLCDVLDSPFAGVINICNGRPISVRRLVEEHMVQRGVRLELLLGHYPYADYEPMAFWGDATLFEQVITASLAVQR